MAQLNSLLVTGGTKLIGDANANNIITGTETVNNQLYVKYKSGTYVNSLTNSAVVVPDQASSFGGWICGPTANGRIAISSYQASDNKLYFGYGERGRTTNSYTKQMTWDGPTNTLTADKFVGALQGNADTATTATKLGTATVGGTTTPIYLNAGTPTALSYTIAKSVPSNAVFTDANVTQTATTTDANYEVLFSATADNTTRTEGARKTTTLRFNPSKGSLMEGDSTVASGTNAHAEGIATTASGDGAHAESIAARATGDGSHAEGNNTSASGQYSHAEGLATNASGARSHAEGQETTASGNCSHATGLCTCAAGANQTVVGKYNVADTSSLFIVGNGTSSARSNALCVNSDNTTTLGASGSIASGNTKAVNGGTVYSFVTGGSARDNTKLPLAGGTLTGRVKHNNVVMPLSAGKITNLSAGTTEIFKDGIAISNPATANDVGFIRVLGTGESDTVLEIATGDDAGAGEQIVFRQYNTSNVVGREAKIFDTAGNTSFPGKLTVSKTINELLTGTGTTAQDKGSGVSPRYFPAKWTMNVGIATPADGDMVTIKIPCAGHDYGVFLSLDNGTTYKPVGLKTQDNGRLTTHFANGKIITLVYDSAAVVDQVFAATGANARSNITGAWKVITNYLDGNNDTYDRNRYNCNIKAWATKIIGGNIIVGTGGLYHHLKEGTAFDITYPILYLAGDCNASATTTNTYDIIHFTVTTTQSISLTAYTPVYIKGTLSGNTFTPVSTTPLLQTVPTARDDYAYILLGMATSATTIYLQERHPIYAFRDGKFGEVTRSKFYDYSLFEIKNTKVDYQNWCDTNAIIHANGNESVLFSRFFSSDDSNYANYHYPCIDSHIMTFTIDNNANYFGSIAQDIRTHDLYIGGKDGSTWRNWRKVWDNGNLSSQAAASGGTGVSLVTTGEKYTWNSKANGTHGHAISDISWAGNANLTPTATANGQEWSIDLNPGTYTGTYWQIWSSKNSKTILSCYTDDNSVQIPNGPLTVSGGNITIKKSNPMLIFDNTKTDIPAGANVDIIQVKYKNADNTLGLSVNPISIFGTNSSDGYNVPVRLGSNNGTTIVSAGESGPQFASKNSKYNDEILYLVADGSILLYKDTANDGTIGVGPLEAAGFSGTITNGRAVVTSGTRGQMTSSSIAISGDRIGVAQTSGTSGGISLYNGAADSDVLNYGIAFRKTSNLGVHGYVQGDWATYFTMDNGTNRGWVYRYKPNSANVASISAQGHAVFNGSVTVGGNTANTSGGRMEYNSTNHCIDFIVT